MIEKLLIDLKLLGALHYYQSLSEDSHPEDLLKNLLQRESDWRSDNKKKRRLQEAKFPYERHWQSIDPKKNPKIPFEKIRKYSQGEFIHHKKNLCFMGAPGLGKTHCAVAIGRSLCELGYSVKFTTASQLVSQLKEAQESLQLTKLMDKLLKASLLIIDELGFVPLSDHDARLLFEVFSKRYDQGSMLVTTNLDLPKWVQVFGSKELTTALIDRFTHRCDIYVFEGESYRFMEAKSAKARVAAIVP